jgi:hypothetical protein
MTRDELVAHIEATRPKPKALSAKVSQKGAVSIYGLQRFPVTLYASQWVRLLDFSDAIVAFIEENEADLATKE